MSKTRKEAEIIVVVTMSPGAGPPWGGYRGDRSQLTERGLREWWRVGAERVDVYNGRTGALGVSYRVPS